MDDTAPPPPGGQPPRGRADALRSPGPPPANGDDRALLQALDLVPQAMAFFDRSGMLMRANHVLRTLVDECAGGEPLFEAIVALGRDAGRYLSAVDSRRPQRRVDVPELLGTRTLGGGRGVFRLHAHRIDIDLFGLGPSVMITVEAPAAADEAVILRHHLTRSELKVARLLAEGRSNKGIAMDLGISAHTARHHTQRVLQKLGARSRAEVGRRLHS